MLYSVIETKLSRETTRFCFSEGSLVGAHAREGSKDTETLTAALSLNQQIKMNR